VAPVAPAHDRAAPITAVPLPDDVLHPGPTPRQLWAMLRANLLWIAAFALGLTVLTAVVTMALPRTYQATAGVLISYEAKDPLTGRDVASFLAPSYLSTQLDLLRGRELLLDVVDRLGWAKDPERAKGYEGAGGEDGLRQYLAHGLGQRLSIETHKDSRLVSVGYSDRDPAVAAQVANLVAQAYLERHGHYSRVDEKLVEQLRAQLVSLEAREAGLARDLGPRHPTRLALAAEQAAVRERLDRELNADDPGQDDAPGAIARRKQHANASLASPATPPLKPDWPKPMLNLVAALLAGGLLGAATALLREFARRRVLCRDDLERDVGLPVLVEMPGPRRWLGA
jgi:uncharacterized protein involved in exopolysaccharide biosynthesis